MTANVNCLYLCKGNEMTRKSLGLVASIGFVTLLYGAASPASAQTAPSLGSAQSFAVLGASTVTNTGSSVITGDLGVSPGTAITGFPPGLVMSGTIHAADAAASAAQNSVTTAYTSLASQTCTQDLTGQDLGGKTLTAGVYCFSAAAQLTGVLTLNAQGNANAVFIFKIGSTLTTASASSVVMSNGALTCNVFWQVGSSATLGTTTSFAGNILALASITVTTGARVTGRALARTGAVTLDTNAVNATTPGVPPTPIVTNYTFAVPFTQLVAHPCQPGFELITGTMNVAITTTQSNNFTLGLQVASAGRGDDADATGLLLPTGAPYYEYSSATTASASFPDGTPSYFEHTLPVTDYLARIASTTDAFIMAAGFDVVYNNGIPAMPTLQTIAISCQ
jgi:Ice-binding-like